MFFSRIAHKFAFVVFAVASLVMSAVSAAADQNQPPIALPVQETVVASEMIPVHLDLDEIFDDEDGAEGLVYEIVDAGSAKGLVVSTIDATTGMLTLIVPDAQAGDAEVVVQATDAGGLSTHTTIPVVAAPLIELKALQDITVDVNTERTVIDLTETFVGADLVYRIIDNTNEDLFDSIVLNSVNATLTLFYSGVPGTATITVQAEDLEGDIQQDSFTVTVSRAPINVLLLLNAVETALSAFAAASFDYGEVDFGYGGGDPCFIATAAYNTPMDSRINILRDFRDAHLLTSRCGTAFVDFYYHVSPPIAQAISRHPLLAQIVRAVLTPVVAVTQAISTKPGVTMVILLALMMIGGGLLRLHHVSKNVTA